jgi:malonyl-CoA O-methyltransferase
MTLEQRFARLVTVAVVRVPWLWRLARGRLTRSFDRLAPQWDALAVDENRLRPMAAALAALPEAPARVLDLGTGTGSVARLVAGRWPEAEILGVDVSPGMLEEARRRAGPRERYELGDASALPHEDGAFSLVTLNNMIPFFDELARVTAPGGSVVVSFSRGERTPIYVPPERLHRELGRRGFRHVGDYAAGPGLSLLARREEVS